MGQKFRKFRLQYILHGSPLVRAQNFHVLGHLPPILISLNFSVLFVRIIGPFSPSSPVSIDLLNGWIPCISYILFLTFRWNFVYSTTLLFNMCCVIQRKEKERIMLQILFFWSDVMLSDTLYPSWIEIVWKADDLQNLASAVIKYCMHYGEVWTDCD